PSSPASLARLSFGQVGLSNTRLSCGRRLKTPRAAIQLRRASFAARQLQAIVGPHRRSLARASSSQKVSDRPAHIDWLPAIEVPGLPIICRAELAKSGHGIACFPERKRHRLDGLADTNAGLDRVRIVIEKAFVGGAPIANTKHLLDSASHVVGSADG